MSQRSAYEPIARPARTAPLPAAAEATVAQAVTNLLAAGYRIIGPDQIDPATLDRVMAHIGAPGAADGPG
ncbi:MAG: hypothetical protein LC789_13395 [Actinobacteria bacterium]|nr:hypothetical protein [Actinomycetota bacterium]MCA1721161.1 hypothetical protein [Actinomycetota bacterium]